jgi:hypothetical protein
MKCEDCGAEWCNICGHGYGDHYVTYDGSYMGCAQCRDCEGFGCASNSIGDEED